MALLEEYAALGGPVTELVFSITLPAPSSGPKRFRSLKMRSKAEGISHTSQLQQSTCLWLSVCKCRRKGKMGDTGIELGKWREWVLAWLTLSC